MAKGLTRKQELFCAEYCIDGNGKRSAIAAGYSPKTADKQASQLLDIPRIQEEIKRRGQKICNKLEISAEKVLQELAKLAFFDPRKFYNTDGSLKHPTELDDETAMALAGMEVEKLYERFGKGQAKEVGTTSKIKIADKGQNLERLGRHLKLFTDKIEVTGLEGLAERIAKARARR